MIGDQVVCRGGVACDFNERGRIEDLAHPSSEFASGWAEARSQCRFLATDLTAEYVRINADYST